jgi:hypothetical protein
MIGLYAGLPRQGKTFNAVYDLTHIMRTGRRVLTNTPLWTFLNKKRIDADYYPDPDEYMFNFLKCEQTTIFCDEASLYFAAIGDQNLTLDWFTKFRQAGKLNCDLFLTAQSWMDVTIKLRRVIDTCYLCTKRPFLIPFPLLNLQRQHFDKKTGVEVISGPYIAFPTVYHMLTIDKGYFLSNAIIDENKDRYILGHRILYPSQFREYTKYYNHEFVITASAVGDLATFGKYNTFEEAKRAGAFNHDRYN